MEQSRRNLELKVLCRPDELRHRRALLARDGIPIAAHLWQRDVYFRVPQGRQKLRWTVQERDGEQVTSAELITYSRPDEAASRWSAYSVREVPLGDADELEATLRAELGVLATVTKRRELAFWGATRVHLDEVEELGCFIELETVITSQSDDEARREHEEVIRALRLDELPAVAGSYSDPPGHNPASMLNRER